MAHGRRRRRPILVTSDERGLGKWLRCTLMAQGYDFGWREAKLTVERAPWWRRSAGGERHGGHHLVVVVTGLWLGEKSGAQAMLTVASMGRSCGQRCRAMVVCPWTWQRLWILSPAPLLCRHVRADLCLRKGWHPLCSWTVRSRRGGMACQRRQRGAGARVLCGMKRRATASAISGRCLVADTSMSGRRVGGCSGG
jgi:hypothetical protein